MKFNRLVLFAFCFSLLFSSLAPAEESFKLSSLNPFSKKKDIVERRISDEPYQVKKKSTFQLPKWNLHSKKNPHKPSGWQKMNSGTKSFFAKSKEVLMPWSKSKKRIPVIHRPRTTEIFPGRLGKKKKSSFFSNLFKSEEEILLPRTPSEFIGQDRPGF